MAEPPAQAEQIMPPAQAEQVIPPAAQEGAEAELPVAQAEPAQAANPNAQLTLLERAKRSPHWKECCNTRKEHYEQCPQHPEYKLCCKSISHTWGCPDHPKFNKCCNYMNTHSPNCPSHQIEKLPECCYTKKHSPTCPQHPKYKQCCKRNKHYWNCPHRPMTPWERRRGEQRLIFGCCNDQRNHNPTCPNAANYKPCCGRVNHWSNCPQATGYLECCKSTKHKDNCVNNPLYKECCKSTKHEDNCVNNPNYKECCNYVTHKKFCHRDRYVMVYTIKPPGDESSSTVTKYTLVPEFLASTEWAKSIEEELRITEVPEELYEQLQRCLDIKKCGRVLRSEIHIGKIIKCEHTFMGAVRPKKDNRIAVQMLRDARII